MRYYDAIHEALKAHDGQKRKLEKDIYAAHPIEVGFILSEYNLDYEVIIAGILHDTIEDTYIDYNFLKDKFGKKVADLVKGVSEDDKSLPWDVRKQASIDYLLNEASIEEKYIICADKLSNIRSFCRSIDKSKHPKDSDIWNKFHAGFEKQKWYYKKTIEGLDELKHLDIYKELIELNNKCFY